MAFNSDLSPADISALTKNNDDTFGGGGAYWLIILFLFIFAGGWGNRVYGTNGGVSENYTLISDMGQIERKIDGVYSGICDSTFALNNSINNGFASAQSTMTQGFAGLNTGMVQQGYETRNTIQNAQITDMQSFNALQSQLAQCCCDVRDSLSNGFGNVKYDMAMNANNIQNAVNTGFCQTNFNNQQNTRDIIANQDANTRAILDSLVQSKLEAKNDKIQEQAQMISALQLSASQSAQNQYLISQLKAPCPIPAYTVPNPYCNCNNGCC